jgi:hypothetical protein
VSASRKLDQDEQQLIDQIKAKRLQLAVDRIPEKSRETLRARLTDQGKEPSDENVLAEWHRWRHLATDRDETWTNF